ncbi:MAG: cytochrome c peroxidase [Pseudomonadota bacterium]|nr:cytochrome c peroxidase [Pseudomonadota bacterium]
MTNRYWATMFGLWCAITSGLALADSDYVYKAGDPSLQEWLLPAVPHPKNNAPSAERASLGKMLFFDPRLSGDGNMSCATCHSPLFGWSDGLPTAKGFKSKVLGRASPTVTNTAFNHLQMWDGRKKSLEDQAIGPMLSSAEMNVDLSMALRFLQNNATYVAAFERAYPGQGITDETLAMAIANFERTVISNNSPFDRWIKGDAKAMTAQQVNGFKLFVDPAKGNCAVCHSAPNFTDNGFHNIGLDSWGMENPDMGRYAIKPIGLMKGAFKTPTLRDITLTAPYFHDGSAMTLKDVVDHYETGGTVTTNLSPNMKKLSLSQQEKADLVEFMKALTTPPEPFALPVLPPNTF